MWITAVDGIPPSCPGSEEMVKQFACGDVVPGCEARWEADSEDELLGLVGVHAADAHGIGEVTPELVGAVRAHIVDAG